MVDSKWCWVCWTKVSIFGGDVVVGHGVSENAQMAVAASSMGAWGGIGV